MRRISIAALLAALSTGGVGVAGEPPRFDVVRFFAGRTEGHGLVRVMFGRHRHVTVHGIGTRTADGITLAQTVDQEGKPERTRRWSIRQTSPSHYEGTLTDAAGPITGDVTGDLLHLRFALRGKLRADQWIRLAPDGQSAANHLTVRKMGIVVATLNETIVRVGD